MTHTIIYFKGIYDTLDLLTDHLIEAFTAMGYDGFVYDATRQEESKQNLISLLEKEGSVRLFTVVTFNNLGYKVIVSNNTTYNNWCFFKN